MTKFSEYSNIIRLRKKLDNSVQLIRPDIAEKDH
jgi:hypothetical protein